jgi:hypothetical protein
MTKVVGDNYPRSINQYVPNMEFAADVVQDSVIVSLGSPATLDADGIWDGVSATNSATAFTSADYKNTFDGSSTSVLIRLMVVLYLAQVVLDLIMYAQLVVVTILVKQ